MQQLRSEVEKSSSRVSLYIGPSFSAAREDVLVPWFKAVGLAAVKSEGSIAVVTPYPSAATFLRSKLLEHRIPLLGVKFMTPALLRELLLADGAETLPLREH